MNEVVATQARPTLGAIEIDEKRRQLVQVRAPLKAGGVMSMKLRAWTLVACLVMLGGCGSKAPVVVVKKPVIKTIAVMQVVEPKKIEPHRLSRRPVGLSQTGMV